MKKLRIGSLIFVAGLILVLGVSSVLAEETGTTSLKEKAELMQQEREAKQVEIKAKEEAMKQERETKQAEMQTRTEEREQERLARQEERGAMIQEHAARLTERFSLYEERLSAIYEKFSARLATMAEEGKDVGAAQAKLLEAKAVFASAKTLGEQAVAKFMAIDPASYDTQREQALAARDLADQAREQYRNSVKLMKEAVELAKSVNIK
ncbi:MAG: hypothetical protein ABII80_01295 [bacterium]